MMESHREGVLVFGQSLEAAYARLMYWYEMKDADEQA